MAWLWLACPTTKLSTIAFFVASTQKNNKRHEEHRVKPIYVLRFNLKTTKV
jgi:hypothetical protein